MMPPFFSGSWPCLCIRVSRPGQSIGTLQVNQAGILFELLIPIRGLLMVIWILYIHEFSAQKQYPCQHSLFFFENLLKVHLDFRIK